MKKSLLLAMGISLLLVSCGNSDVAFLPDSMKFYLKDVVKTQDKITLNAVGTQNILVLPIQFSDYTCDGLAGGCAGSKQNIETAFFGEAEDTGWESVASFYQKSSYGKLNITGTVADWYQVGTTFAEAERRHEILGDDPTWYILRDAVQAYKDAHDEIYQFDKNMDGYIDAVWMIYSAPYSTNSSTTFEWAFTFWDYLQNPDPLSPVGNAYAWASYQFIFEGNYSKPDAHSYIHETGHLLGLEDYYSYDTWDWSPVGQLDMMDGNIGDHDAFSKGVLGWTEPFVAQKAGEITLRPFESTGDCLIIGNQWNGTMFSEYLLLEYYTPTGLNQLDAELGYPNRPRMFTQSGLKVLHIDARLGAFKWMTSVNSWVFTGYTDQVVYASNPILNDFQCTRVLASNTPSISINPNYRLIHLLESSGRNTLATGLMASNQMLFKAGDSFGLNAVFKGFTFHDAMGLPFGFTVKSMNDRGITIQLEKIK